MQLNNRLRHVLHEMLQGLDGDLSLDALGRRVGRSPFYVQRAFRKLVGETPKQYTQRLRLERAAARLAATGEPVLGIALSAGFANHETFTRAFRRRFGCSPSQYRAFALSNASEAERARHVAVTDATGPCIGLFLRSFDQQDRSAKMPMISIERRELVAQPILFIRRQAAQSEIADVLGQCLGMVFGHCQKAGHAVAGQPFTRYPSAGPGLVTLEVGCPLAAPVPGDGEIEAGFLQSGAAAVAVHAGPYDQLRETYAAVERWMEDRGERPGGPPWEVYVTDPGDYPDPKDWRTEVYWPMAGHSE
jgi:AraC family transcriptional regulator